MKKKTRRRVVTPESKKRRALHVAQETVRTLGSDDLTQAASGCDTTSWTTEAPPKTQGAPSGARCH